MNNYVWEHRAKFPVCWTVRMMENQVILSWHRPCAASKPTANSSFGDHELQEKVNQPDAVKDIQRIFYNYYSSHSNLAFYKIIYDLKVF